MKRSLLSLALGMLLFAQGVYGAVPGKPGALATHRSSAGHRSTPEKQGLFPRPMVLEDDIRPVKRGARPARQPHAVGRDVSDTLVYTPIDGIWNAQFIQWPGDAMMMMYQMPADGYIQGVNVPVYEWGTGDQQLTISLHAVTYPYRADGSVYPPVVVDQNGWIGGYDMDPTTGWVSIAGTDYTPGGTPSVCIPGYTVAEGAQDPLGSSPGIGSAVSLMGLVWPDSTVAATLDPANNPDVVNGGGDNWVNTADYGSQPFFSEGEWIGILVASTGAGGGDDPATGFFYDEAADVVEPWVFAKFYDECGGTSGNGGWHIRHWMIDFELAVLYTGDRGPAFVELPNLPTTFSTADRPIATVVRDDNPEGGPTGVATVTFYFQLDSANAPLDSIPLTLTSGTADSGTWTGVVPGQPAGTRVYWFLRAVDVNGNTTTTLTDSYYIFQTANPALFLYNSDDYPPWIMDYYLSNSPVSADFWSVADYGFPPLVLLNNYSLIIEVTGSIPVEILSDTIRVWHTQGGKRYLLCGDEWLGIQTGWINQVYSPGDFQYDVLGIAADFNDVNYLSPGDQVGISRLLAIEGDTISGELYSYLSSNNLYFNYDPISEVGFLNWIDGVTPVTGAGTAFRVYAGTVPGWGSPDPGTPVYDCGIYYTTPYASKSVFLAFDPLATNADNASGTGYVWIGVQSFGPLQSALNWLLGDTLPPTLSVTPPDTLDFHNVYIGYSASAGVQLRNAGDLPLEIYSLVSSSPDFTILNPPGDTLTLPPNVSHEIILEITPTAVQTYQGTLTITSNDTARPTYELTLLATALMPPVIAVSPDSLEAALLAGDSLTRILTIDNSAGGSDLVFALEATEVAVGGRRSPAGFHMAVSEVRPLAGKGTVGSRVLPKERSGGGRLVPFAEGEQREISGNSDSGAVDRHPVTTRDAVPRDISWLRFVPADGTVSAGSSVEVVVTVDATALYGGEYLAEILVTSNDPAQPEVVVPVTLQVTGVPDIAIGGGLYDSTSTAYWSTSGAATTHQFVTPAPPNGDGTLYVTVDGDYNSSTEYADVYVEDSLWATINPGVTGPTTEGFILPRTLLDQYVSDGVLTVVVNNSPWVDPGYGADLHEVRLTYPRAVGDSLVFGAVYVGHPATTVLEVSNLGSDTLLVSAVTVTGPAFSADVTTFALLPQMVQPVVVTFTPPGTGQHTGTLTLTSNDPDEPVVTVALAGVGVNPPQIVVIPDSIVAEVPLGTLADRTLTIDNSNGGADLTFTITIEEGTGRHAGRAGTDRRRSGRQADTGLSGAGPGFRKGRSSELRAAPEVPETPATRVTPIVTIGKGETDPRIYPRFDRDAGGPDAFGYRWQDSNEPGGPQFEWIDAGGGTDIWLSDDDFATDIPLGFTFTYYGIDYTTIGVGSNGWLSFNGSHFWFPASVPFPDSYVGAIAPMARDLYPPTAAYIRYQTVGTAPERKFVVEYNQIPNFGGGYEKTFEVILYEGSNTIRFQYLTAPDDPYGFGIESPDETMGLGNAGTDSTFISPEVVQDNYAIEFSLVGDVDWITMSPTAGTVPAGGSLVLDIILDGSVVEAGEYGAHLIIESNDPATPVMNVPVHMTVVEIQYPPTAFDLINPGDGGTVVITPGNLTQATLFSWVASMDPNGTPVIYSLIGFEDLSPFTATGIGNSYFYLGHTAIRDTLQARGVNVVSGTWTVIATSAGDTVFASNGPFALTIDASAVLAIDGGPALPRKYALHQNYPNPFNPATTIRYDLPERSSVTLVVYDLLGREVRTLVRGVQEPGFKAVVWDGRDDRGRAVGAGVYFYRITAGEYSRLRKMVLLK
jgi:hypothetical protein